jgi:hypothetical protein
LLLQRVSDSKRKIQQTRKKEDISIRTLLVTRFLHADAISGLIAELIVTVTGVFIIIRNDRYILSAI